MNCSSSLFFFILSFSLASAGCKSHSENSSRENLTVFAAASLTDVFQELASEFEKTHPETDVKLNFAGSQVLRLQIEQGASFDLFASADEEHLNKLSAQTLVTAPVAFAVNQLVVITPRDNPAQLRSYLNLPIATHIVLAEEAVPLGHYTLQFLKQASALKDHENFATTVASHVVSRESNARLVRAKVELGEADAAVVYKSDAIHSQQVKMFPIPPELNVQARYFIGRSTSAKLNNRALTFVNFLQSSKARGVLEKQGFQGSQP